MRWMREKRAVDERVDFRMLKQRHELAVDRRLGEVELDELDLAADLRGSANIECEDARVARVLFEPSQQLAAQVRARAGHRDDAAADLPREGRRGWTWHGRLIAQNPARSEGCGIAGHG